MCLRSLWCRKCFRVQAESPTEQAALGWQGCCTAMGLYWGLWGPTLLELCTPAAVCRARLLCCVPVPEACIIHSGCLSGSPLCFSFGLPNLSCCSYVTLNYYYSILSSLAHASLLHCQPLCHPKATSPPGTLADSIHFSTSLLLARVGSILRSWHWYSRTDFGLNP